MSCFRQDSHLLLVSPISNVLDAQNDGWILRKNHGKNMKWMNEIMEKTIIQHNCASIATQSSTYIHKIPYVSIINWYQVSWSSSTALRSLQLPPASSFNHACTVAMATGWFMAESAARKSRMRPCSSLAVETRTSGAVDRPDDCKILQVPLVLRGFSHWERKH